VKTFIVGIGAAEKPYHYQIKADGFDIVKALVIFSVDSPNRSFVAHFPLESVVAIIEEGALAGQGPAR